MIASLRGTVLSIGLDHAVVECNGVGYLVHAVPPTLATLRSGEEAFILTSMVVKEDSMTLYGFTSSDDREMFHLLQTVSGLGPRLALASLSVMGAPEISRAIAAGDVKALQRIPGVGKKVAERISLELKDKVKAWTTNAGGEATAAAASGDVSPVAPSTGVALQVTEALVGLGFTEKVAAPVVDELSSVSPEASTSELLRAALSRLGGSR